MTIIDFVFIVVSHAKRPLERVQGAFEEGPCRIDSCHVRLRLRLHFRDLPFDSSVGILDLMHTTVLHRP